MSSQKIKKGEWAENYVWHYLEKRGYKLVCSNLRTPWAQIDLFLRTDKNKLLILEVKFVSSWTDLQTRLSSMQKARLCRARLGLQSQFCENIALGVAFVQKSGQIDFIDLDEI